MCWFVGEGQRMNPGGFLPGAAERTRGTTPPVLSVCVCVCVVDLFNHHKALLLQAWCVGHTSLIGRSSDGVSQRLCEKPKLTIGSTIYEWLSGCL